MRKLLIGVAMLLWMMIAATSYGCCVVAARCDDEEGTR